MMPPLHLGLQVHNTPCYMTVMLIASWDSTVGVYSMTVTRAQGHSPLAVPDGDSDSGPSRSSPSHCVWHHSNFRVKLPVTRTRDRISDFKPDWAAYRASDRAAGPLAAWVTVPGPWLSSTTQASSVLVSRSQCRALWHWQWLPVIWILGTLRYRMSTYDIVCQTYDIVECRITASYTVSYTVSAHTISYAIS